MTDCNSKTKMWAVKYKVTIGHNPPTEHIVRNVPNESREEAANMVIGHFKRFMEMCLSKDSFSISILSIQPNIDT